MDEDSEGKSTIKCGDFKDEEYWSDKNPEVDEPSAKTNNNENNALAKNPPSQHGDNRHEMSPNRDMTAQLSTTK